MELPEGVACEVMNVKQLSVWRAGTNYHLEALKFKQDSLQPGQQLCESAFEPELPATLTITVSCDYD